MGSAPHVRKIRLREVHPVALCADFPQLKDLIGLGVRKRAKKNAIHDAEDCRCGTNAQSQRKHRNQSETGILHQHARAKTQIPQQYFKDRKPSPLTNHLFGLLDAAKFDQRLTPRLFRAHSCAQILFGVHPEMAFQFGGQIRIVLGFAEQPAHP